MSMQSNVCTDVIPFWSLRPLALAWACAMHKLLQLGAMLVQCAVWRWPNSRIEFPEQRLPVIA